MRPLLLCLSIVAPLLTSLVAGQAQQRQRLNPVISLLDRNQPVFGIHTPTLGPKVPEARPTALARDVLAYTGGDVWFDGNMESGIEPTLPTYMEFVRATAGGASTRGASAGPRFPLIVKTPKLAGGGEYHVSPNVVSNISRLLNTGTIGIHFVEVETADEVRQGLAAMRFKSKGGTRPDDVGMAPAIWGMSEQEYRQKADLWPLNPDGELVNWTMVETEKGLANVREIAAVKGIGALWVGAGSLRSLYSKTNAAGQRVVDTAALEKAVQQVLSACKEFQVACAYPANAGDVEMRMKQGFSVFMSGWSEGGRDAIAVGRKAAGRSVTNQ